MGTVEDAQRRAAKVAGLAYVLSFVIVVSANFGATLRLVSGGPAETARNILAHQTLFRLGLVGDVLYCIGILVLTAALYLVLKPVDQNLALLATFARLVQAGTWVLVTLNCFTALRILSIPEYSRILPPDQLPILARLYLSGYDQYYVGLSFWSLAAALGAYLLLKSGYVPRALAVWGLLASVWCIACTFALYLFPDFAKVVNLWWFDSAMALYEIALGIVLVFRGIAPRALAARTIA